MNVQGRLIYGYSMLPHKETLIKRVVMLCLSTPISTRALGSIEVKVTWLFKKWQRESLILCTRTDRAAAVTFNGIIDCFRSTTAGFRFFCDSKSWTE